MRSRFLDILAVFLLFCTSPVLAGIEPAALDVAGVYKVGDIDPNLTGKGVNIGLVCRSDTYNGLDPRNDYRPDISHDCFKDMEIKFYDDKPEQAGVSPHSTAIASILAGLDANAVSSEFGGFSYEGVCPDAQIDVYEFRHFIAEYVFEGFWPQVDLLTMSLGWVVEDWWTRGIDNMAENFGVLVIAAIGNGKSAHDLPLYPAAGANVLAVGVADSAGTLTNFSVPDPNRSTQGPTLDGRCKPDIIAPGNCLIALAGTKDGFAASGDYSSFAAPVVTGVASMLIQKARSNPDLRLAASPFMGNCILKSILMTSAKKLPGWHKGFDSSDDDHEYPLDFKQGAGMVDAKAAYNVLTAGVQMGGDIKTSGWTVDIIEPNYSSEKVYNFKNEKTEEAHLSVVLTWNKVYQNRYPFEPLSQRQADLQIELWKTEAGGNQELVDYSDSPVDNIEHLYTNIEPNTEYKLVVSHSDNSELPQVSIPYAISWQVK
ncbi:MAG: S8 family serine peptidase [Phycisphaerae bacterium]|nr:S8 family serine peptidase [Phycisphaerae bacterium]